MLESALNKNSKKQRVIVGMSGGVDSSTSAALLNRAGFDVVGVFMKCWNADELKGTECTAEDDEYWARRAAAHIGIPFYSVDLVDEYKKRVVDYFVREYSQGRTPNPDVMCNDQIKFGVFFDKAIKDFNADFVATGHYARIKRVSDTESEDETVQLFRGADKNKDQTYFLYRVGQRQLQKTVFPLGEYTKPEVRNMAREFGLPNSEKKDSQGLCFIGHVDVREFLNAYIPEKEGVIINTKGEELGRHVGSQFYTIGQRHGLGIGGGIPYYVVDTDPQTNTVVVGKKYDEELFSDTLYFEDERWINTPPKEGTRVTASIRYRQEPQPAHIYRTDSGWVLRFEEPQRAVTPGQSVVLHKGDRVLGGGIII